MMVRHLLIFLLGISLFMACAEEPDCDLEGARDELIVKFYNEDDSAALEVEILKLEALGGDSVFYVIDTTQTYVLPLNPIANEVTYLFRTRSARDTLSVKYKKEIEWISESCGPSYVFSELEIISTTFEADLISSQIDNSVDENISIYY